MVEAKKRHSGISASLSKSSSRIMMQTVTLDTEVPPLPNPEELRDPPDSKEYERAAAKMNFSIRKLKAQLRDLEVAGEAALGPEELNKKLQMAKDKRSELHNQREQVEKKDKALRKEIMKDPNYAKYQKCKKKLSLHQTIQRKEKINNIIDTATLSHEEEKELFLELESIAKMFPLLIKINEREKLAKEGEMLWKQINELSIVVEELEKRIRDLYDTQTKARPAEGRTDGEQAAMIREQIEKISAEKRELRWQFEEEERAYRDQQFQFQLAKLVAKRKQDLIKSRANEEKERKSRLAKCQELIQNCEKIAVRHKKTSFLEENPQTTNGNDADCGCKSKEEDKKGNAKGKGKDRTGVKSKKKKQKQKKAEKLVTTLELDTLREDFQSFEVAVPTGRDDLGLVIKALYRKAKEIESKPLPESIALYPHRWEDSEGSDTTSVTSFSPSGAEDFSTFDPIDDQAMDMATIKRILGKRCVNPCLI